MNVQMSDLADSLLRILSGMGTKARQPKMRKVVRHRACCRSRLLQEYTTVLESVCRRDVVEEDRVLQGVPPVLDVG